MTPAEREFDEGIRRACCAFDGAEKRWAHRRERGLTDAELRSAIGDEFGISGGRSGPDTMSVSYAGGDNPRLWIGDFVPHGKPTLKGVALMAAARRALSLPYPHEASGLFRGAS